VVKRDFDIVVSLHITMKAESAADAEAILGETLDAALENGIPGINYFSSYRVAPTHAIWSPSGERAANG
jgi:hypothetical protein